MYAYIPTTDSPVTVTDYTVDSTGEVTLGQAPAGESSPGAGDAAVLDWDGSYTPKLDTILRHAMMYGREDTASRASAVIQSTRTLVGATIAGVHVEAVLWSNLFEPEPDFRTDIISADDWMEEVSAEDWTLFIVDDTDAMKTFRKQPSEVLAYDIDFTQWFAQIPEDHIQTADCTVTRSLGGSPDDVTVVNTVVIGANGVTGEPSNIVKVWLSGGADGATYHLTLTMRTEDGRVKETDFKLKVKNT